MKETVQDLKIDIEVIKKTQTEGTLGRENLGKQIGTTYRDKYNRKNTRDRRKNLRH